MTKPCNCVFCGDCGGTGHYWVDMSGQFLGLHRSDDLCDLETCTTCGGSGITETCENCLEIDGAL